MTRPKLPSSWSIKSQKSFPLLRIQWAVLEKVHKTTAAGHWQNACITMPVECRLFSKHMTTVQLPVLHVICQKQHDYSNDQALMTRCSLLVTDDFTMMSWGRQKPNAQPVTTQQCVLAYALTQVEHVHLIVIYIMSVIFNRQQEKYSYCLYLDAPNFNHWPHVCICYCVSLCMSTAFYSTDCIYFILCWFWHNKEWWR